MEKGEQQLFTMQNLHWVEHELDTELPNFKLMGLDNKWYRVPNPCYGNAKYQDVVPDYIAYSYEPRDRPTRLERRNFIHFADERALEMAKSAAKRDPFMVFTPEPSAKLPPLCSAAQARHEVQAAIIQWEASARCRNLIRTLESAVMPNIDKIIAFGLGAISARSNRKIHQEEYAIALTIARILRQKNAGRPVSIYVQDPDYTPVCKEALPLMGFQVIECHGALGFTMIDERTFVMSHNASIPIREIVADVARPAAMYWKPEIPQEEHDRNPQLAVTMADVDSVRTRRMMTEYDRVPIPGASLSQYPWYDFGHRVGGGYGEPFGNSALYVRKPAYANLPFDP